MNVTIDTYSGFCFGVVRAINAAEKKLDEHKQLYSLGDIVHNGMEVKRLSEKGLKHITYEEFKALHDCNVLIRAHGEPPETYKIAKENNIKLIDTSCPIVLKLQDRIRIAYEEMKLKNGQIVIYGKPGHAEVNGLAGQTDNTAIVVENEDDIEKIDFSRPTRLYAQTTESIEGLAKLSDTIKKRMVQFNPGKEPDFKSNDTICRHVSNRGEELKVFSKKFEVIIFVSGKKSSNGMILFELCKSVNPNTYLVEEADGINKEWFAGVKEVGICGATSTPMWLMETIADTIRKY
ncbi:MAG: 4-hydroxy-3-methylbut-2-enyl diphosphate reductase [Bacteroidetes bacterium]|nr:4-hydroxy-3-methylbut-2-enyl diphosphate reductase [Bacteroidota bacterium]